MSKIAEKSRSGGWKGWNHVIRMFREDYPQYDRKGLRFEPHGYNEIRVFVPGVGKMIYNMVGVKNGKLQWEERWVDETKEKQRLKDQRLGMYQRFLTEIAVFQKRYGLSQGDLADMTGVSRQSINKYLSGVKMPKMGTMQKICESLGITI